MKRATSLIGVLTLATLTFAPARAEWKFISLMRGEPESATAKQRVAFVGSAVVKKVEARAERLCGIDCWSPLKAGEHLKTGDVVRTGNGAVILKMDQSESFVKLAPNTLMRLLPLDSEWDRAALTGCEEREGFAVRSCRGNALFRDTSESWKPVLVNSVLADSAVIRTGPESTVDLFCTRSKRTFRVEGNKQLKLAEVAHPHTRSTALASLSHQ